MPFTVPGHRFLFVNVPQTCGDWTRAALDLVKCQSVNGPPAEVPWLVAGNQVIAQITDPWSWYARLHGHLCLTGRDRELRQWGNGDSSFAAVLKGWTRPETVDEVPSPPGVVWAPYGPGPHPPLEGGLWSWTYRAFLGDLIAILVDQAQLIDGWSFLLARDLEAPPPELDTAGPRALYTRPLKDRVRAADRELIEHCGYQFLRPSKDASLHAWPPR